jgi:outer membrane protein insertion porin family/translocation and assembly module TamA
VLGALVLGASLLAGCFLKKELPVEGPVLQDVEIVGGTSVDHQELLEGLATRASPTFLLLRGVAYDYEVLDQALLERDLERVERYYRARGYVQAKVTAARVVWTGPRSVRVVVLVDEGLPLRIPLASGARLGVELSGLERITDASAIAEVIATTPRPGKRFDEDDYERSKSQIRQLLRNGGYAFASVTGTVQVDLARREAYVRFDIDPGDKSRFGRIAIRGLSRIPEQQVRRSLLIREGDEYSAASVKDAERALINLGVFTSVRVDVDLSDPQSGRVGLRFVVREAAPRTLRLGLGTRLDAVQLSASLTSSWEHVNFLEESFQAEAPPRLDPLTERELDVLRLMAAGHSNREIGEALVLAVGSVKWYASQIYSKLQVKNRTEAAAKARALDLL